MSPPLRMRPAVWFGLWPTTPILTGDVWSQVSALGKREEREGVAWPVTYWPVSMQMLLHSEQCKEHWTRILMMSVQWTMRPGCSSQVVSPALKGLRKPAGTWPRGSLTPIPERRKYNFILSSSSRVLTGGIPVPSSDPWATEWKEPPANSSSKCSL